MSEVKVSSIFFKVEDPWTILQAKSRDDILFFNDNKQPVMPPRTNVRGQGIFNIVLKQGRSLDDFASKIEG